MPKGIGRPGKRRALEAKMKKAMSSGTANPLLIRTAVKMQQAKQKPKKKK